MTSAYREKVRTPVSKVEEQFAAMPPVEIKDLGRLRAARHDE